MSALKSHYPTAPTRLKVAGELVSRASMGHKEPANRVEAVRAAIGRKIGAKMREPIFKIRDRITGAAGLLVAGAGFAWFIGAFSLTWREVVIVIVAFAGLIWLNAKGRNEPLN